MSRFVLRAPEADRASRLETMTKREERGGDDLRLAQRRNIPMVQPYTELTVYFLVPHV